MAALHIRSYRGEGALHSHDHVQIVLPIAGSLEIEVTGRGRRLSPDLAAFIAPGERHCQEGLVANRSLVLDVAAAALPAGALDRLATGLFLPVGAPLRHLVGLSDRVAPGPAFARRLLGALLCGGPDLDRFERLEQAILAEPALDWSVDRMTRLLGMSRTQLYRALADERATTPARLVTTARLALARRRIEEGARSLAELAVEVGFSDQAALTRAMRRETGRTPGAWRRPPDAS